jgi:hypothetical protein
MGSRLIRMGTASREGGGAIVASGGASSAAGGWEASADTDMSTEEIIFHRGIWALLLNPGAHFMVCISGMIFADLSSASPLEAPTEIKKPPTEVRGFFLGSGSIRSRGSG